MAEPEHYFFCIGPKKSGTTILARMLDQHPDVACIWESFVFKPEFEDSVLCPDSERGRNHGFDPDDVRRWRIPVQRYRTRTFLARVHHHFRSYYPMPIKRFRSVYRNVLDDFGRRCGVQCVGDKWPYFIDYLEPLLKMFPKAKYIYNVRDPRGIWNSGQKFKGRQLGDHILRQMLHKDRRMEPYCGQENFLSVRYEDLIGSPEETCRKLFEFLGCDFDPSYLTYSADRDPYPHRWDFIPEAGGQLSMAHTTKWKQTMTPEQIERVNEMAGEFLDKYGYDR